MKTLYLSVSIIILTAACSTLDDTEIKELNNIDLELQLVPDYDLYEQRFDINRDDYYTTNDEEGTSYSLPYHTLGFNLGNGLFFDLNHNLSLRIDQLFEIKHGDEFEIMRDPSPKTNAGKRYFKMINNTYYEKPSLAINYINRFKIDQSQDPIQLTQKHKLQYSITCRTNEISKANKRKTLDGIYKHNTNFWTTDIDEDHGEFFYIEDYINLNEDLIIEISKNKKKLFIYEAGETEDHLIYTLERNNDIIYIYNDNFRGYKVKLNNNDIKIYHNNKLTETITRLD